MADTALEDGIRKSIVTGQHRQTDREPGQIAFRYLEIHFDVPQIIQSGDGISGLQVSATIHLTQANNTRKGGANAMVMKVGLGGLPVGSGRLQRGTEGVHLGF